jgi:hypothetical protein
MVGWDSVAAATSCERSCPVACDVRSGESSLGAGDFAIGNRVAVDEAFATWWSPSELPATKRPSFTGYPFTLGVAFG